MKQLFLIEKKKTRIGLKKLSMLFSLSGTQHRKTTNLLWS